MKNQSFVKRLKFAFAGIQSSWQSEKSFRFHVVATLFIIIILLISRPAAIWWAILLISCGMVMSLELVNTAIEKLVDHLHPDLHPAIKIVKDTLAGAILLASIIAVCVFVAFVAHFINL